METVIKTMVFDFHPSQIDEVEMYSTGFEDREEIMRMKGQDVEVKLYENELSKILDRGELYNFSYKDRVYSVFGDCLHPKQEITTNEQQIMRNDFTIETMANLNKAISHYMTNAVMMISQPSRDNERGVKWNEKLKKKGDNFWWNRGYGEWRDFEVHLVKQNWGSTSAGWGGIGGAAMTTTYTTVIHSSWLKIIAVYYNDILAYVMDITDQDIY